MEDAEEVRVACSAIPTALDCTGDLVAGDDSVSSRDILRQLTSPPRLRVLAQLRSSVVMVDKFILCEGWGLPMNVIPPFSSVCLDFPSIPLMVRHNLLLSVMWFMLSSFLIRCRFGDLIIHCRQPG